MSSKSDPPYDFAGQPPGNKSNQQYDYKTFV